MTLKAQQVLAAVAVADIESAIGWYTKLMGRECDNRPMKEAADWLLASGGGIQLVSDKERAGRSMTTIGVSDIDALVADIGSRGIKAEATPPSSAMFRLAQVEDLDGNVLTFAQKRK